jgi:hypothetical protein
VLKETGLVSAAILFLLIAAGLYSRMLSMAGVPQAIGDAVEHLGLGAYGFLAAFVVIVLLMGMILDSTSILLIMVPIGAPIAQAMGFDLIHFGIVTIIAVEMGPADAALRHLGLHGEGDPGRPGRGHRDHLRRRAALRRGDGGVAAGDCPGAGALHGAGPVRATVQGHASAQALPPARPPAPAGFNAKS